MKRIKKVLIIVSLLICFLLLFACSKKLDTVEPSSPESIHESEAEDTTTGSSESIPESEQSVEESKESSAASSEETTVEQTSEGTENATEATTGGETTVKTEKPSEAQTSKPSESEKTTKPSPTPRPTEPATTTAPPVATTKATTKPTTPTTTKPAAATTTTTTKPATSTKPTTTTKPSTTKPTTTTTKPTTTTTKPPTTTTTKPPTTTPTKPPTTTTTTTQDPSVEYWDSDKMFVGEEYFWGEKDGKKIYVRGILNKTGKKASETINQVAFNKINEYRQSQGLNTLVRNTAVQSGADRAASIIAARKVQVRKTGHIYSGYDAALTYIIVNGMSDQRLGEEAALAFIESPAHAEILKWSGTRLSVATWRFNSRYGDEITLIININ